MAQLGDHKPDGQERRILALQTEVARWKKHAGDLGDLLAKREDEIAELKSAAQPREWSKEELDALIEKLESRYKRSWPAESTESAMEAWVDLRDLMLESRGIQRECPTNHTSTVYFKSYGMLLPTTRPRWTTEFCPDCGISLKKIDATQTEKKEKTEDGKDSST
jgi:hypothetical protein